MTIKEIAELCGVTEQTVLNWIHKLGILNQIFWLRISEKLNKGSPEHPSDYDLEETLAIIGEGGGNKALASLLAENAANKDAVSIHKANKAADSAALERVRQAAMEGINEITELARKMVWNGCPGDPLRDLPPRLNRIIFKNGGRVYVMPQKPTKTKFRILVYDKSGAFIRVGLASVKELYTTITNITKPYDMGMRGEYEEVEADDILKWHIELAGKQTWKVVLKFELPDKKQAAPKQIPVDYPE